MEKVAEIQQLAEQYNSNIPSDIKEWLTTARGLNEETIASFKIGWNGKAITIPIYDRFGQYQFFKFRKSPNDTSDFSKYWYSKNSSAELYGWEHITNPKEKVIICEGELDRLVLESNGMPAITATSGAGTFREEWIDELKNLPSELFLCYDNDKAGMDGAEKTARVIPRARIIRIPDENGIKDITDFITKKGIEGFRRLIDDARTLEEIEKSHKKIIFSIQKNIFPEITLQNVIDVLGLTIKEDNTNKVISFLCCLSAYTDNSQFNISFNAPSSSGKSYIPLEIGFLFPKEDVIKVGYCSPTAFFHDHGIYNKELGGYFMDLERKIMIFLDQPHNQLLAHLRPLLSHDEKEIRIKITDKSQKFGLKTKNVIIRGYPSVVFCSAGLKIDEQEATRFLLLSPETTQEKLRQGIKAALDRETDRSVYLDKCNSDPQRRLLIDRIAAVKEARIDEVKIHDSGRIEEWFFTRHKSLKPRHQRDIKRLSSIIKSIALLNLWHRKTDGWNSIFTSDSDIDIGFKIWEEISYSQELNLSPYTYKFFEEIIKPLYEEKGKGLTRKDILQGHFKIYGRPLEEWKLRREIIPMLEMAGLITQEKDPDDKRNTLITPIYPTSQSTISQGEINVDFTVG